MIAGRFEEVAGRRLPVAVPVTVAVAWALSLAAQAGGRARLLHHDVLLEGGFPVGVALVLFLLAWQVMVAAMMLPSSLPLVRLFAAASADQERRGWVMAAFLAGYALVWTGFGAGAFVTDAAVHSMVEGVPWLEAHSWFLAGGALALAGAFQFSALKHRCLEQCRHPAAYLLHHYRRGVGGAFRLGSGHGLFCLGCCWALMVLMFGVGVANLSWMAALTVAMVYEKTGRHGRRSVPLTGVVLLVAAVVVLLRPGRLPIT